MIDSLCGRNNKQKDIRKEITDIQSLKIDSGSKAGMTSWRQYAAFTLAEGAAHTNMSAEPCQCATTLVESSAHANMSAKFGRCAFTLAEVLITLGIIGIVAAQYRH